MDVDAALARRPGQRCRGGDWTGVTTSSDRLQVGKKLKKPQNETQLDFKARSIALPAQKIGQMSSAGAAVSERNLTLQVKTASPPPPDRSPAPSLVSIALARTAISVDVRA